MMLLDESKFAYSPDDIPSHWERSTMNNVDIGVAAFGLDRHDHKGLSKNIRLPRFIHARE